MAVLPLAFARRLTDRGKAESEGEDAHPGTSSPVYLPFARRFIQRW